MDGTKVERKRPERCVTEPLPALAQERTRIKANAPVVPHGLGLEERVTLFAHSLSKEKVGALLDGFSSASRDRAQAYLTSLAALPSSERQGRLGAEFGIRHDSSRRLREVWAEAGPALRRELFKLLPPFHRTIFPDYAFDEAAAPADLAPALKALAERLIREATR